MEQDIILTFSQIIVMRYFMGGFILSLHIHRFQQLYFVYHPITTSTAAYRFVAFLLSILLHRAHYLQSDKHFH